MKKKMTLLESTCAAAGVPYMPEYEPFQVPDLEEPEPVTIPQGYFGHTEEMKPIFPEDAKKEYCTQKALNAGVLWILNHPGIDIVWHKWENEGQTFFCYDNEGGEELQAVLLVESMGESDVLMMIELAERLDFIAEQGWEAYVERERKAP